MSLENGGFSITRVSLNQNVQNMKGDIQALYPIAVDPEKKRIRFGAKMDGIDFIEIGEFDGEIYLSIKTVFGRESYLIRRDKISGTEIAVNGKKEYKSFIFHHDSSKNSDISFNVKSFVSILGGMMLEWEKEQGQPVEAQNEIGKMQGGTLLNAAFFSVEGVRDGDPVGDRYKKFRVDSRDDPVIYVTLKDPIIGFDEIRVDTTGPNNYTDYNEMCFSYKYDSSSFVASATKDSERKGRYTVGRVERNASFPEPYRDSLDSRSGISLSYLDNDKDEHRISIWFDDILTFCNKL